MVKSGEKWGKGVKKMFLGEYRHSLDDKGRLFIPAKLRDALGKHFFISKGFDHCCGMRWVNTFLSARALIIV